jgi:uncharacterized delta-60 repeat protein
MKTTNRPTTLSFVFIRRSLRKHLFYKVNSGRSPLSKRLARLVYTVAFGLPTLLIGAAGSLDPTFGNNGIVTTSNTSANAAALQSDSKLVVGGSISTSQNPEQPVLLRYNTNGTLDPTFGTGGKVIIAATTQAGPVFAVTVQSDGKILAAGPLSRTEAPPPANLRVGVFRFNPNGTSDKTFGNNGVASVSGVPDFLSPATGGIVEQSDGKILVAATSEGSGVQSFGRLLPNGQPDSTFGANGVAPLVASAHALALQPGGQILVLSGPFGGGGTASRYNTNGSVDTTFSGSGQAPGFGSEGGITVINSTGKFIVVGSLIHSPSLTFDDDVSGFLLVRYLSNGVIDSSFGKDGVVVTPFPGNVSSSALSVAIQSNGDIVAAGQTATTASGPSDFALARYTTNGALDPTFGHGGFVSTSFGSSQASVNTVLIQTDGKILAVGNSNGETTIARYLAD